MNSTFGNMPLESKNNPFETDLEWGRRGGCKVLRFPDLNDENPHMRKRVDEPHSRGGQLSPEENLWTVVLTQAIDDLNYQGNSKEKLKEKAQAKAWVESPDFEEVCSYINLDPSAARRNIWNRVS